MARLTESMARPFRWAARQALGNEYRNLEHTRVLLQESMRYTPWTWMDQGMQTRLQEMNPDSLRFLQMMQGYEQISAGGSADEPDRLRSVNLSRWGVQNLILIDRMINMWTDFAFGQNVSVTIKGADGEVYEPAQEIWDRFFTSRENSYLLAPSHLYRLSNKLLRDGELFWPFYVSTVDGAVQMRSVDTTQITRVITEPDDDVAVVGYQRESTKGNTTITRYYRDWRWEPAKLAGALQAEDVRLGPGKLLAAKERVGTDVVMMQVAWNTQDERGWPQFGKSVWWAYQYQQFLTWRLTLDKAVATFWEDIETKGGSRATDYFNSMMQSSFASGAQTETNPPPVVGTPFVHNEAVSRKRMPLTTGASDAELDGLVLVSYVGLDGGIPPHWLGRPDAMQNKATAREVLRPAMRQWARLQLMWANTWRDVARLVLGAATIYPKNNPVTFDLPVDELDIDTTMDTPTDADFAEMVDALVEFGKNKVLGMEDVSRVAVGLPELGITDPEETLTRMYPPEGESALPDDFDVSNLTTEQRVVMEAAARKVKGSWL